MWQKRAAEWESERQARQRLMSEVICCPEFKILLHNFCPNVNQYWFINIGFELLVPCKFMKKF